MDPLVLACNPVKSMLLDFEKPIALLEERLSAMRQKAAQKPTKGLMAATEQLEKQIRALQAETFRSLTAWQRVQLSRHPDRPYTLDYIAHMTQDFMALHGDRVSGDDAAIVGGLCKIGNMPCVLIGHQKGRTTQERQARNFGMAQPAGYRKALRLMRLAEKFNKPILTLIDTPGAYPGLEAEERGQALAIAQNIQAMVSLRVPVVCVVIGEGASGGALGLGVGDSVCMLENTWYSVISPESCASILWDSWRYKEQAAEVLKLTAQDMLRLKLIDSIIPEPLGGAHRHIAAMAAILRDTVLAHLTVLNRLSAEERVRRRMDRWGCIG